MSRDTRIGLLLAVGFLTLVGGVLYYRIEHPDELEHFWNGTPDLAQQSAEKTGETPTPSTQAGAANPSLQLPPPSTPPSLDAGLNSGTPPATPPAVGDSRVVVTGGNTPPTGSTDPAMPQFKLEPPGPPQPVTQGEKSKDTPVPSGRAAAPSTDSAALPAPPTPTFPLDSAAKPEPDKSAAPLETNRTAPALPGPPMIAPENIAPATVPANPSAASKEVKKELDSPWVGSNPPTAKPEDQKNGAGESKPTAATPTSPPPPALTGKAPELNLDVSSPGAPALQSGGSAAQPMKPKLPVNDDPKNSAKEKKGSMWDLEQELQGPPIKSAPLPKEPELPKQVTPSAADATRSAPPTPPASPWDVAAPAPAQTTRDASAAPGKNAPSSLTGLQPETPDVSRAKDSSDGQYREYAPPRAGLGRPVPDSVLALNERRWSDQPGIPSPVVPSRIEPRQSGNEGGSAGLTSSPPQRRVTSDSRIRTVTVVQGETFSSLSQRFYASEAFADALAAYNQEEGFVKTDQPTGNQVVLLPDQLVLETRYGNLLRKTGVRTPLAGTGASTRGAAPGGTSAPATAAAGAARVSEGPNYRVKKGEQLFDVAKATLGDGYRWGEIYTLNKDILRDSTELRPDMMLRLPVDAKLDSGKQR